MEKEWIKLKKAIHKAIVKKETKIKERKIGCKFWWDKKSTKLKRKVNKAYKWKRGKGTREGENEKDVEERRQRIEEDQGITD